MRILVAGATGHTGERVARRFAAQGHEVLALSRRPSSHPVVAGLCRAGVTIVNGDFARRWSAWEALEGCDALVSCAHIRWAEAAIQACQATGVKRYIQMSSARALSELTADPTVGEVRRGEEAIRQSGLVYTTIRPTMIFGGRRDANVTRLMDWFRRRRWFPLFGGGSQLVQPIYVEDLVDVIVGCLENTAAMGAEFTVAGEAAITYREFLTETAVAAGCDRPILVPVPVAPLRWGMKLVPRPVQERTLSIHQVARMTEDRSADIADAQRLLGFDPLSYREAIRLKAAGKAEIEEIYSD